MLGCGVGLMLAALVFMAHGSRPLPAGRVEHLAREMGMVYPQEIVPFAAEESIRQETIPQEGEQTE